MRIFLDTAHLESIESAQKTGLIDGITTNPTYLSKEGEHTPVNLLKKICKIVDSGDVSIEVTESEPEKVYEQAKKIAHIAPNVVVKIPCEMRYTTVIHRLVNEKIPINITLLFSLVQGLMMCKLGVRYISPFIGRLDDIDSDGIQLIYDLRKVIQNYNFKTKILAASLRNIVHVHEVALAGADIATIPVPLFDTLLEHPLTAKGIAQFDADWKKLGIKQFP